MRSAASGVKGGMTATGSENAVSAAQAGFRETKPMLQRRKTPEATQPEPRTESQRPLQRALTLSTSLSGLTPTPGSANTHSHPLGGDYTCLRNQSSLFVYLMSAEYCSCAVVYCIALSYACPVEEVCQIERCIGKNC